VVGTLHALPKGDPEWGAVFGDVWIEPELLIFNGCSSKICCRYPMSQSIRDVSAKVFFFNFLGNCDPIPDAFESNFD
jgi:hypothetical protein